MSRSKLAVEIDEQKIDAIFSELNQCSLPGAAVGIAIGGKAVYRRGFGLASLELPVVLSPSIRMRIASTTKHFTAFAYMLLCEEGGVAIDDPVGKFLPELHPVAGRVTIRQLMGNISGLRCAQDIRAQFFREGSPVTNKQLVSLYRDIDDVNAAPGTAWCYNNGGWMILTEVIERITGQTLEEVMWRSIFEPVGMYDTLLRRRDCGFVPNSATPHMVNAAGGYERHDGDEHAGQGGMISSVDDMLRWLAHMDTPRIGNEATWAAMRTPSILPSGTSTGYGFGLFVSRYRGVETIYHSGGLPGAGCQMLKVPASALDVVIIANSHNVSPGLLVNKVLDACQSGLDPVREPLTSPLATGIYRSATTHRVVQLFPRNGQQIASICGNDMPVAPDNKGVLWLLADFFKLGIARIGDLTRPSSIHFSDFGNIDELVAVKPIENPDVDAIVGRYQSDAIGATATISEASNGPQLATVGRFGSMVYDLECLAEGIWRAKSERALMNRPGVLVFDADGWTFRYSTLITWALSFRRCA